MQGQLAVVENLKYNIAATNEVNQQVSLSCDKRSCCFAVPTHVAWLEWGSAEMPAFQRPINTVVASDVATSG